MTESEIEREERHIIVCLSDAIVAQAACINAMRSIFILHSREIATCLSRTLAARSLALLKLLHNHSSYYIRHVYIFRVLIFGPSAVVPFCMLDREIRRVGYVALSRALGTMLGELLTPLLKTRPPCRAVERQIQIARTRTKRLSEPQTDDTISSWEGRCNSFLNTLVRGRIPIIQS